MHTKKVSYLSAILLALSVHRYKTKCIDQQKGSRAITEATGRRLRASMAASVVYANVEQKLLYRNILNIFLTVRSCIFDATFMRCN